MEKSINSVTDRLRLKCYIGKVKQTPVYVSGAQGTEIEGHCQ